MAFGFDPLEEGFGSPTKTGLTETGQVLVMHPPQKWSNENLNFLVYYLKRALKKRFGFNIVSSETLVEKKAIEKAAKTCAFLLIIFDRPTEAIVNAYKAGQDYDKPTFIIKAYSREKDETPKDLDVPFGLLAGAITHNELGDEEKTFVKLVREMILERDKLVMEMFIQGGELKLEFFIELLKHLDSYTRRNLLKEMADKYPNDRAFWLASGREKLLDGDTHEALRDFDEATRISPDDPWVFSQLGSAMVDAGDFDRAIKEISMSIRLRPINPHAFYLRGNTQYMLDNLDDALESFETASQQKPDFVSALNNLAHMYTLYERYKVALTLLDRAIDIDSDYPFTYLNRAACLREMGRPKSMVVEELRNAEKAALANITRGDDFERSAYCLFYVYAAVGNIEKAADYLQRCVDYRLPIKRWRTLERVWDKNISENPILKEIAESSNF
jgi:tetratricopeptide (TPR) repeat protein